MNKHIKGKTFDLIIYNVTNIFKTHRMREVGMKLGDSNVALSRNVRHELYLVKREHRVYFRLQKTNKLKSHI